MVFFIFSLLGIVFISRDEAAIQKVTKIIVALKRFESFFSELIFQAYAIIATTVESINLLEAPVQLKESYRSLRCT
jgi:hypothetical protein